MSTFFESKKPFVVLRFGPIRFADQAWSDLEKKYENLAVVESSAKNREEFFKELEDGKFKNANYVARTYQSAEFTGLWNRELLEKIKQFTNIKAISHTGAGYDQVDAIACRDLKLQLSNVPGKVDNATADTHVYLLLGALRNFQIGHENMSKGLWLKNPKSAGAPYGHDPASKTVGILGMGGIGASVRDRLIGFGFKKIIYHNRSRLSPDLEKDTEYVPSMEELVKQSDIISINIPLNKDTRHCINKESIDKMKEGVIIVNTARGPVIDEVALKEGLKNGKIYSFGTDVFENEPDVDMELVKMPNVVSLPHMGTHTVETLKSMEELVVENVENYYKTGKVLTLVSELRDTF